MNFRSIVSGILNSNPYFYHIFLSKVIFSTVINKVFILKFLKFGVVGASGVMVDFSVTYVCKEKLKIQKYVSNALGFTVAATSNWFLNRIWTFNSHNTKVLTEYTTFLIISLFGLGINTIILWILTDKMKFNFYLSKLGAIGVVTIWNFFANYLFTFTN
jgi:putative flippase GtrA